MKKAIVFIGMSLAICGAASAEVSTREAAQNSKMMIKELGMGLQSSLKDAIQNAGFGEAINVCRSIAPQMARDIGEKHGAAIHRVSLKLRNASNEPDLFETRILKRMEEDLTAGSLRDFYTAVETGQDGKKMLRVMKPIVTVELCLNCHGPKDKLNPQAAAAIKANYPNDMATGYGVNQVRGAFSVTHPLD